MYKFQKVKWIKHFKTSKFEEKNWIATIQIVPICSKTHIFSIYFKHLGCTVKLINTIKME